MSNPTALKTLANHFGDGLGQSLLSRAIYRRDVLTRKGKFRIDPRRSKRIFLAKNLL